MPGYFYERYHEGHGGQAEMSNSNGGLVCLVGGDEEVFASPTFFTLGTVDCYIRRRNVHAEHLRGGHLDLTSVHNHVHDHARATTLTSG